MADILKIYCDESGYTGRDMLSTEQPIFVYSACQLDDSSLEEIKALINRFRVDQGQEVKGAKFVNSKKGKEAIIELFTNYSQSFRVVYHEKKYVLACKIIEYGIEPLLRSNWDFYESKLNEFLAVGLYVSFVANKDSAHSLFDNFLDVLKGKKSIDEVVLFDLSSGNPLFEWLSEIMSFDKKLLIEEIEKDQGKVGKEVLDLAVTSLLCLLSEWGKHGKPLSVICDDSNVFRNNVGLNHINGIGSGIRQEFLNGAVIGYKLEHDLELGDSKKHFGLQVADLVSSSIFYALRNLDQSFSQDLMKIVHENCMCTPNNHCVIGNAEEKMKYLQPKREYYFRFMKMIYDDLVGRYGIK